MGQDDLFETPFGLTPAALMAVFDAWASEAPGRGGPLREESASVYRDMWTALLKWAVQHHVELVNITPAQLDAYLRSRGGAVELNDRYSWRLLRLVERVLGHATAQGSTQANHSVAELFKARPDLKYANAADANTLPEFLDAVEARSLVAYLATPLRTGKWQEQRGRTAVALHLGAGLTPSEVRLLTVSGIYGQSSGTRKIRVPADGVIGEHEAPIAPWAWAVLIRWLELRSQLGIGGDLLLPATRAGRPWGKTGHWKDVAAVLEAIGLPALGGAYRLRHTFALRQLKRGRSSTELAAWLGVDEAVVQRYRRVILGPVEVA